MRTSNPTTVVAMLLLALVCAAPAFAHAGAGVAARHGTAVDWGTVLVAPQSVRVNAVSRTSLGIGWSRVGGSGDSVRYRVYRDGVLQRVTSAQQTTMSSLTCGRQYVIGVAGADQAGHASATTTVVVATMSCGAGFAVALVAPQRIGRPGAVLRAEVDGSARSVSFGFCRGRHCSWRVATRFGSTTRGKTEFRWRALPPQGTYTLLAHAVDPAGRTVSSTPVVVSVDGTPPRTTITSAPAAVAASTTASFTLGASEPVRLLECRLDEGGFSPCPSSFSLTDLPVGSHTLAAYAVDLAGNVDSTPASASWTVDTVAPDTSIVLAPAATTVATSATFTLAASEATLFECSLDGAAFAPCTQSATFAGLAVGSHRFAARSIDRAGNVDPTPATWAWTIGTGGTGGTGGGGGSTGPPPLETTILSAPAGAAASRSALVAFSSSDAAATFDCALDGAVFSACASSTSFAGLI